MREGRIDYRMRRRAALRELEEGRQSRADACDAHPELVRAGTHIGDEVRDPCPVCDEQRIRHVTYVFDLRARKQGQGGRAVARESLLRQVKRFGDLNVYRVEVCLACHWHHLLESFWLRPKDQAVV